MSLRPGPSERRGSPPLLQCMQHAKDSSWAFQTHTGLTWIKKRPASARKHPRENPQQPERLWAARQCREPSPCAAFPSGGAPGAAAAPGRLPAQICGAPGRMSLSDVCQNPWLRCCSNQSYQMCCLYLMRSYLQARCPALSHHRCHCYCCLGAAMAVSWNQRRLLTSGQHLAQNPLAQTSAGRLPHMLAHCSHSPKSQRNFI